jgi:N-acetylneuraminate synthase
MKEIEIAGRKIGASHSPYVLAELSANHNGKLQRALDTITAAKQAGASAVKLQTYTADTMTIDCDKEDFQIRDGLWEGYKLYDLYKWAETPFEWHKAMFDHARKIEMTCFSTPFDETAVDLLEDFNVPAYKVASFEATDLPLVRYIASTKKPMIISTGMANLEEIEEVVATAKDAGCKDLILLHCISSYPAPAEQSNLMTIPDMQKRFGALVGLSDHTIGNTTAITSIPLGACFIEKHFMLDNNEDGPDSAFSMTPEVLESLCNEADIAWRSLGTAGYDLKPAEEQNLRFRRSVYFVRELSKGDIIKSSHIRRIRPGFGLPPKFEKDLIGKRVTCDVSPGTATSWDLIDE